MSDETWHGHANRDVPRAQDTSAMPCFLLIDYPGFGFNSALAASAVQSVLGMP